MVGRLREKQYQLAAQKQNDAYLKHSYYQQTARYFERQTETARQYTSWNVDELDFAKQLALAKKAEQLISRRNKLRALLQEDEEAFRRELEESWTRRSRVEELSLESLKEKLKERRAEQSLYLPRTCRRYQPRFVYPTESVASHLKGFTDSTSLRSRACQDSTNFPRRIEQSQPRRSWNMSYDQTKESWEQENNPAHCMDSINVPTLKFQARYSRKSLENTNVRLDAEPDEYTANRMDLSSSSIDSHRGKRASTGDLHALSSELDKEHTQGKMNGCEDVAAAGLPTFRSRDARSSLLHNTAAAEPEAPQAENDYNEDDAGGSGDTEQRANDIACAKKEAADEVDRCNIVQDIKDDKESKMNDSREFEREKCVPWLRIDPHDKNLSKQMFLYLTHKELKCKIDDLARRETHACCKQSWNEALRLRDMRNRLELIREKRLYNMANLHLKEEDRKDGMASIHKREEELSEREYACTDSTMYSEEAKALWKKWVHEDESSIITDARAERETLMNTLEQEWQGLAIRDKERISHTFENVLGGSDLQDEHKLTAAIQATRAKSASSTH